MQTTEVSTLAEVVLESIPGSHLLELAQVHELEHEHVLVALQRLHLLCEPAILPHLRAPLRTLRVVSALDCLLWA